MPQLSDIQKMCSRYGIKMQVVSKFPTLAGYYFRDDSISFHYTLFHHDEARQWSVVFHEIGHSLCYRAGKYEAYHEGESNSYLVALNAERYVDRIGKMLMKQYFPKMKYKSGYETKEGREFLREYIKT